MSERDFVWFFVVAAGVIGLYLLVFADQATKRDRARSARAREKYGHRPKILRPKIANQNPSKARTRLVGLGFLAIGGFALWQRLG
ncbi:hypothetical protein ENKNEFLB_02637 [Nocardioides aquaticus]|nr:hypothetical protein [Nocardioides aquaticus]QVT80246.1 hypothetical protein ENKNEFLB_02637 [Nocardioides aquaticus]